MKQRKLTQYMNTTDLDNKYWETLKGQTAEAGITLDDSISSEDFEIYGNRLAERQIKMFEINATTPLDKSSVLDIGCGMGRIIKPFSKKFNKVVGIDINTKILEVAKVYLSETDNVELKANDGKSIPFKDQTFDYVYSGGVLQHIPNIDVITNYFEEGLRVLKENGILNFSIQVWMISRKGGRIGPRVGAKVLANDIEKILNRTGDELLVIYYDEKDPIPHFNIIIKKMDSLTRQTNYTARMKEPFKIDSNKDIQKMSIRTGCFEDLISYENFRKDWARRGKRRVTFFSDSLFQNFVDSSSYFFNKLTKRI